MITSKVIDKLYSKYRCQPSDGTVDLAPLFDPTLAQHSIVVNTTPADDATNASPRPTSITIKSIDPTSPFHKLQVANIHGIAPFAEAVAIVLHSSIIFLNRKNAKVRIHLQHSDPAFIEWFRNLFRTPC